MTITSAPTTSLTFTGLAGTDTLNLTNTGTTTANVTVDRVEAINSTGNGSNAVTIGGTAQQAATTYSGGTGVDSLTISNTYTGGLTVTVTGVETVTGGAFANTINLGLSGTAQAVQLGNAATGNVVNATDNTAASSITGGTGNDQFTVVGQTNLSALATLVGGLGNDTILFNASSVTATDSAFAKVSAVEIISLGGSGAHSITIGATAFAAGITTVTGSTGADTLTITSAPTTSLTFTGQGGSDILNINASVVNPAITVIDIGTITDSSTSTSSVTAITIGGSNATVSTTFTGGVGTDTLTVASTVTSGVTVSVANVESITGGAGNDIVTITSTGTTTVNGGTGSNDLIVISASSNTVTVNASNIDFVNDTMANTSVNTVNFTAASKTTLTNVESIVGSSGNDTLTSTIGAGYTLNAGQTYNLAGGAGDDVLTFSSVTTSASVTIASAFTFYANAGDGADTITMGIWAGTSSTATQYNIVNGGAGADTVTFAIAPTGGVSGAETTVTNLLRENLTNFTVGDVSLTSADQVLSGFTAANVGSAGETIVTSRINLTGATFVTAANTNVSTTVDNGTGGTNYTAYTTVSVATAMANFQDSANIGSVIFVATNNITTSSFTAQAGITAAVTYITGTIGTSGNAVNQNAMIAVNDGTNTALFNYVEGATLDAGIQAGELTLVGVVQGKTGLTALNFS